MFGIHDFAKEDDRESPIKSNGLIIQHEKDELFYFSIGMIQKENHENGKILRSDSFSRFQNRNMDVVCCNQYKNKKKR